MLIAGIAFLSNPAGWAALGAALLISHGIVVTTTGAVQLATTHSRDRAGDATIDRALNIMTGLTSPAGLAATGIAVASGADEERLERYLAFANMVELGVGVASSGVGWARTLAGESAALARLRPFAGSFVRRWSQRSRLMWMMEASARASSRVVLGDAVAVTAPDNLLTGASSAIAHPVLPSGPVSFAPAAPGAVGAAGGASTAIAPLTAAPLLTARPVRINQGFTLGSLPNQVLNMPAQWPSRATAPLPAMLPAARLPPQSPEPPGSGQGLLRPVNPNGDRFGTLDFFAIENLLRMTMGSSFANAFAELCHGRSAESIFHGARVLPNTVEGWKRVGVDATPALLRGEGWSIDYFGASVILVSPGTLVEVGYRVAHELVHHLQRTRPDAPVDPFLVEIQAFEAQLEFLRRIEFLFGADPLPQRWSDILELTDDERTHYLADMIHRSGAYGHSIPNDLATQAPLRDAYALARSSALALRPFGLSWDGPARGPSPPRRLDGTLLRLEPPAQPSLSVIRTRLQRIQAGLASLDEITEWWDETDGVAPRWPEEQTLAQLIDSRLRLARSPVADGPAAPVQQAPVEYPPQATPEQREEIEALLRRWDRGPGTVMRDGVTWLLGAYATSIPNVIAELRGYDSANSVNSRIWAAVAGITPVVLPSREDPRIRGELVRRSEAIGTTGGMAEADARRIGAVGFVNPFAHRGGFGQGLDDLRLQGSDLFRDLLFICEYKGESSREVDDQMELSWVLRNVLRLHFEGGATGQRWAATIALAWREGRLRGITIYTRTRADGTRQVEVEERDYQLANVVLPPIDSE